jgi:DNA-binding XRE family transcriptional regulator
MLSKKVTRLSIVTRKQAANRLRSARIAAGLTQETAAELCGVSARSWGAWERGAVPLRSLEVLGILEAFGPRRAA